MKRAPKSEAGSGRKKKSKMLLRFKKKENCEKRKENKRKEPSQSKVVNHAVFPQEASLGMATISFQQVKNGCTQVRYMCARK
jgi:hypothetical protein